MDWVITQLILISLAVPLLAAITAKQSTTWNDNAAYLTLDLNSSTCAVTGYSHYSWYVLDLGTETTINKVDINGRNLQNIYLTVGNNGLTSGPFEGFTDNHDCYIVKDVIPSNTDHEITCFLPVTGRYITLEMLSEGHKAHQLEICEFSFQAI